MDKIKQNDPLKDKYAKCAGNLNNVIEWEAAEKMISPLLISNWYMTNPGGFSVGDFDVFLTTGLTEIHENADLTYLGKVLDKIGNCPLLPITVGFCTGTEKSDFQLGTESVKVLREIAERCKSIGVKGDYSAEVLKGFAINNVRIVGTPALYTNISTEKSVANSAEKVGSVSASFRPFYGAFSESETKLLKYFADNSFRLICASALELDDSNIKDGSAQPEIVLHLAEQPIVRESYKNPAYTYETNVMGTVNILECVRNSDCVKSFLNVTTDKVSLNKEWPWGYRENEELDGFDPYSNSKSCSELVTHSYKNSFFADGKTAISTARAGNVIGGGDFAADRIIPDCVRAVSENRDIIVRNPYSTRPYQHVLEPLFAYLMIAEKQYCNAEFSEAGLLKN